MTLESRLQRLEARPAPADPAARDAFLQSLSSADLAALEAVALALADGGTPPDAATWAARHAAYYALPPADRPPPWAPARQGGGVSRGGCASDPCPCGRHRGGGV